MAKGKESRVDYILAITDRFTRPIQRINDVVDKHTEGLRKVADAADKATRGVKRLSRVSGFQGVVRSTERIWTNLKGAGGELLRMGAWLGGAGAAVGYGFQRLLLGPMAAYEDSLAILEQFEGGAVGAGKAMDWIQRFAATTPYELQGVTDAFVRLRAYGMDPTSGLLKTLGDTASAMGKDVMDAVEAIADAVTGENERLKEFGIKARTEGKKITYEYTDAMGRQMTKTVDKSNRAQIQSTLEAIWNEKYAGAMDKRSKTWRGMWSNAMDWVNRFTVKIMQSGAFDWLRGKLKGLLEVLDEMDQSGRMEELAETIGGKVVKALKAVWSFGHGLVAILEKLWAGVSKVVQWMGGWENAAIAVAAILGGKLLVSVTGIVAGVFGLVGNLAKLGWVFGSVALPAIKAFSLAMLASPFTPWLVGIAAVASAVWLVIRHWDTITAFFSNLWDGVVAVFHQAVDWIKAPFVALFDWLEAKFGWVVDTVSGVVGGVGDAMGWIGDQAGAAWDWAFGSDEPSGPVARGEFSGWGAAAQRLGQQSVTRSESLAVQRNESKITVSLPNLPKGARVEQQGSGDVDLDMGYAMTTP